jgi:hypothetical protein
VTSAVAARTDASCLRVMMRGQLQHSGQVVAVETTQSALEEQASSSPAGGGVGAAVDGGGGGVGAAVGAAVSGAAAVAGASVVGTGGVGSAEAAGRYDLRGAPALQAAQASRQRATARRDMQKTIARAAKGD